MNRFAGQAGQFRDPAVDIEALRVEPLTLCHRIEYPEIGRGIGAGAGNPLPAGGVHIQVGIDKRVLEPGHAVAPVHAEMLDQE